MLRTTDWVHGLTALACRTALASVAAGALLIGTANATITPFNESITAGLPTGSIDTDPATPFQFTLPSLGLITDLNIYLQILNPSTNFYWTDTEIDLKNDSTGTTVRLKHSYSCTSASCQGQYAPTYDDEAAGPYVTSNNFDNDALGTYQVDGPGALSDFDGEALGGTWTLTFHDVEFTPSDGDYLNALTVFGEVYVENDPPPPSSSVPEPGTLAMFGLGLAGLGFARRRKAA